MSEPARERPSQGLVLFGATAVLLYLGFVKFLLHLFTADNYGYFRDELYYVAAGEHLDFGYVDFPPLVALLAALTRSLFGDSLLALHVFLTGNYGEAGAADFFGPEYGLPGAISGHNSYFIWGPRGCSGEVVISVGVSSETLREVFGEVQQVDTVRCRYCMPDEDNLPVYVCRDPKMPFEEAWPRFEHYD